MITGKELIKSLLPDLPNLPGVYRFVDPTGVILYIGKAKNLKNRISQYGLEVVGKTKVMINLACIVEYIVTVSETEALLLEGQMIKKFKPRFNILLKDDKSFPYIKLRLDHEYPQLLKFRGRVLDKDGKFFGPFASAAVVDTSLLEIQKIFKLRSCTDAYMASRARPCLQYQIKRCSAPCVNKISKEEYAATVGEAKAFLSGKSNILQDMLVKKMEKFSADMEYEKAAEIRDKLKAISYVQLRAQNSVNIKDADVIAVASQSGEFCVQMFLYRDGQPCGNRSYFPEHTSLESTEEEVLASVISQIYQDHPPASELLLSHDLPDADLYVDLLRDLHDIKVKISTPKLGSKLLLIENALRNAEVALEAHLKTTVKNNLLLKEIQDLFELPQVIERIEIYDNSHIQGAFPVGAMVVAGSRGFEKKEYRLFNIEDKITDTGIIAAPVNKGDDYGMLAHVIRRRLKRVRLEPHKKPDLMIIDGGIGHLNVVHRIMEEMNIFVPFVCMSKGIDRNSGREYFHQLGKESFTLDKNQPVMKYLQILRDEVHNFAITSHRKKRSAAITVSSLDSIEGIGAARKKLLLNYFGSFAAIQSCSEKDLSQVPGISANLANKIFSQLHKK